MQQVCKYGTLCEYVSNLRPYISASVEWNLSWFSDKCLQQISMLCDIPYIWDSKIEFGGNLSQFSDNFAADQ